MRQRISETLDFFYPRYCEACGRPVDRPGRLFCSDCLNRLPFTPTDGCCRRCGRAAEGLDGEFLCEDCRTYRPSFDRAASALSFEGDARVSAKLNRGATTDFNAMTRTDRCYHSFGRRRLDGPSTFVARAPVTVLFLAEGDSLELSSDDERIAMVRYDAMLLDQGTVWKLDAGQGMIFIVDIHYYDDEDDLENEDGHYDD